MADQYPSNSRSIPTEMLQVLQQFQGNNLGQRQDDPAISFHSRQEDQGNPQAAQ